MKPIPTVCVWLVLLSGCTKDPNFNNTPNNPGTGTTVTPPPKPDSIIKSISFRYNDILSEKDTANNFISYIWLYTASGYRFVLIKSDSTGDFTGDYVNSVDLIDTLGKPFDPGDDWIDEVSGFPVNPKAIDSLAFRLQNKNGSTYKMYLTKNTVIIGDLRNLGYSFMANWYNKEFRKARNAHWLVKQQ